MKVNLVTYPFFLKTVFATTRLYLKGVTGVDEIEPHRLLRQSFLVKLINPFLILLAIVSFLMATVLIIPDVYYRIFPADIEPVIALESGTPLGGDFSQGSQVEKKVELPARNENLPKGNWLIIPRIGVRTQLQSSQDPAEALKQGVWMAPDYGQPGGDNDLPIILAAHRFGWEWWWQTDYWKYHSFYQLPDLELGDIVEVISDQRKWTYEIYAGEQGETITDYEADLILYTCKFLNSPLRYFRYARWIDLSRDTQS